MTFPLPPGYATTGAYQSRLRSPSDLWQSSVSRVTKEELSVSTRQTKDNKATKNRSMMVISLQGVLRDRHKLTFVGLNSGLAIANETVITKEGYCHLRNGNESHTTSLLDNREHNYRQSSGIVCSLLVYQTHNKRKHY